MSHYANVNDISIILCSSAPSPTTLQRPTGNPVTTQAHTDKEPAMSPTFADVVRMPPRDETTNNEQLMQYDPITRKYSRNVQTNDTVKSNKKTKFDTPPGWRIIDPAEYGNQTDTSYSDPVHKINAIVSQPRMNTEIRNPVRQGYPSVLKEIKPLDSVNTVNSHNGKSTHVASAFKGKYRGRVKMYYIGGIDRDSNQQGLEEYLLERHVTPLYTSVFNSRNGDLAAKITVPLYQGTRVEEDDFWPRFARCRQWLSRNKWDEYRNNYENHDGYHMNAQHNAYYDDYNQPTGNQYRHDEDYSYANID